jgi:hypothetical protein
MDAESGLHDEIDVSLHELVSCHSNASLFWELPGREDGGQF